MSSSSFPSRGIGRWRTHPMGIRPPSISFSTSCLEPPDLRLLRRRLSLLGTLGCLRVLGPLRHLTPPFSRARYVLTAAARARADERHEARPFVDEVVLAADKDSFHFLVRAVEDRRAGVASVGVQVGDEERPRCVIAYLCAWCVLLGKPVRMSDHEELLRRADLARAPVPHWRTSHDRAHESHERPIGLIGRKFPADDLLPLVHIVFAES